MEGIAQFRTAVEHLYIHIPFCPQLCDYCSFYSEKGDAAKTGRFLDALIAEAQMATGKMEVRPRTVFFGGGTPSALSVAQFDKLLGALRNLRGLFDAVEEWTIEMNPATVSADKARLLRDYGVNRISMGVQAFDDDTLKMLNRVHDSAQVIRSYDILRAAGFDRVNLDLIFAVPGQTMAQWEQTLRKAMSLDPDHMSCYCLTYEEDTEFWNRLQAGRYSVDESLEAEMFLRTRHLLREAGFDQYEISNYAKPGLECRHNLAYWNGRDYAGWGPSAFGTVRALRYQNVANTDIYCERIEQLGAAVEFTEALDGDMRQRESWMFGLRTRDGIDAEAVQQRYPGQMAPFIGQGWVEIRDGRLTLTESGLLFADEVAGIFV